MEASIFGRGEQKPLSETGRWVYDNFVVRYNIEVIYEWRDGETNQSLNLIPPREQDVVPFMRMLHTGWMMPYIELCGEAQMKPIFPKQVQLFGSGGYSNSTKVQGTAEGGKKLILYDLDNYRSGVREDVKNYIRIMHHEFGHLLNQWKDYPLSFKSITPDVYTQTWYNESAFLNKGFVSAYAMVEPDEDFVETLAQYVTDTPAEWAELLAGASAAGLLKIENKLATVRTYMEENYGVDIDLLRALVTQRIDDVTQGNYK
jgi:substrate import-associated zinc metallohydrolase lipoprotein